MKEIAKKTIEKIEKEQVKLDSLLAKREEITTGYQAKLAEINESIKEQEKVIASLREHEKSEKLAAVALMFKKSGVSVDDLLNAVTNNDLYGLQEKLENKGTAKSEPAAPAPVVNESDSNGGADDNGEADDEFALNNTASGY